MKELPRNKHLAWQELLREETRELCLQATAMRANLALAAFGLLEARTAATRTLEESRRLRLGMDRK